MSESLETPNKKKMKEDFMDTSEEFEEPPTFSPAALGLHRVGTVPPPKTQPVQPIQILNARGMPARIRKRNKLFFDDDIINDTRQLRAVSNSPKKASKPNSPMKTPTKVLEKRRGVVSRYMKSDKEESKEELPSRSHSKYRKAQQFLSEQKIKTESKTPTNISESKINTTPTKDVQSKSVFIPADKKVGQQIGLRLRNLLKLPKAHKWVSYEWFYSYIDKPLFEGDNDFQVCLKEVFPKLKTRMLTRTEWSKIRSMMGKIRRCSQRFFDEERRELERKRQKIRLIQNKKTCDVNFYKDLPNEIPLLLPVGTKVQARLRAPQDGIFYGVVDAVDSLTSTYRITFDRPNLGTHSIPDFEIISDDFNETISLASLLNPRAQRNYNGNLMNSPLRTKNSLNKSDPLLGQEIVGGQFRNPVTQTETIGGFPVKLLELLVRLKKTLLIKQSKLQRLRDMNADAEIQKSRGENYTEDFQRRYASIVISMEKLNKDMQEYLNQVQQYAGELTNDPNLRAMLAPTYLREKCREAADEAVTRNNSNTVQDENMLSLITKLATILLVASHLNSDGGQPNTQVLQVFEGCIEEVKNHLNTENIEIFQKSVQIHLHHIRLGLGQVILNENNNVTNHNNNADRTLTSISNNGMLLDN
ncbi:protein lin-9 homolog [Condylostylus longicornis]|uniref:protein lin-9 homolog n=1 Tax=Condylostylus longicornis TaxID=2530218 RepID=UPI00244E5731|nr:protein lin-9 homolog [Condylostylus longicornis]